MDGLVEMRMRIDGSPALQKMAASAALSVVAGAALKGHTDRVWCVSWSPTGEGVASCGGDGTVRFWRPILRADGSTEWVCGSVVHVGSGRTVRCAKWSPNGRRIAAASFDGTVSIFELQDGELELVATLEGHENEVKSVAWSASGLLLATCSRDKSIWVWESSPTREAECVSVLHGHSGDVKFVRWHPSLDWLVSASYDNSIRVWLEDGEGEWFLADTLENHESTVWAVAFDKEGRRLVSCGDDRRLVLWDVVVGGASASGSERFSLKPCSELPRAHSRTIFSVDWCTAVAEGAPIASGGADDAVRIFTVDGKDLRCRLEIPKAHAGDVNCVAFSPVCRSAGDGRTEFELASCGDDGLIKMWRVVC